MCSLLETLLFPQENACHLCERFVEDAGVLCARCRSELLHEKLKEPVLGRRLLPLEHCLSAYPYAGIAREMILSLKYRSDGALAQPLGESMCMALLTDPALYRRIDLVIPVPLHSTRLYERGYNQAELLARAMAKPARLPVRPALLERVRATHTQIGRSRAQRMQALRGAFAAVDASAVQDRCILLVDDVFTTGATAIACAEALRRAGAKEVSLLTACRA